MQGENPCPGNGSARVGEPGDFASLHRQLEEASGNVLERLPAMGPILMLYLQSAHRRHHFVSDLEWLLLPPLVAGQCKLYLKKQYPVSFISWALLNQEAEAGLTENGGRLRPQDWSSGDNPWIIDVVAPFGGVEKMLLDIRRNEFPGRRLKLLLPDPSTDGVLCREIPAWKETGDDSSGQGAES